MRAAALAAALLAACTAPPPTVATPTPTAERGVLTVAALLDLSGPRAAVGTVQRDALQLWLDQEQGRTAFPVRIRMVDVGGSDAKLLVELRHAAVEDAADAVIVGSPVAYDDTLAAAVDLGGVPALFTLPLPADPSAAGGGRWAFALAPTLRRLAASEIGDAALRGTLAPSLVLADVRERVDPMATALAAELQARRLDPLTRVAMPADGSVPPVVRSGLSVLRSVHCTGLAAACVPVAQAAQAASAPTLLYLSYLTVPRDLTEHRDLAARAIWPGTRTILPFDSPPITPVNQARASFLRAFGDRFGPAGTQAATAFDAISLLYAAAQRAGPDDREGLRGAMEGITMPLIASTYTFAAGRHAGSDPDDVAYLRWAGAQLAPALAPSLGTGIATPAPSATASPRATSTASRPSPAASARP